jgi:hypothetical protein
LTATRHVAAIHYPRGNNRPQDGYNWSMELIAVAQPVRRPRFRRAPEPPAFRLTDDDVEIVRQIARHRFLRSTHIAALVGRSLDRTNDRLRCLYHAGYIDRPRAQLDRFPTSGSASMVYALADRGARLLRDLDGAQFRNLEWSRKNREAGRPFIEHQVAVANFQVALEHAARARGDVRIIPADEMIASPHSPITPQSFELRSRISHRGAIHDVGVVPDLVFGLRLLDGARRNFMVEIDRGTMPVVRSDLAQTSFARKMRVYLAGLAGKQHERRFEWKTFRVLTVTSDRHRLNSMLEAARQLHTPGTVDAGLFAFATYAELAGADPLAHEWRRVEGGPLRLI